MIVRMTGSPGTDRRPLAAVWGFLLSLVLVGCAESEPSGRSGATAPSLTTTPEESRSGELREGLPLGEHSFDLYVPASYQDSAPAPVVIALHGRPRSSVEDQAQLQPLADQQRFLVAYPRVGSQQWQPELDSPDIAYLRELIAALVGSWSADPERIYLTGMSAGGDMAIAIGLQLSDVVAAVAPVVPPADGAVAELVEQLGTPVPVVAFLGTADHRFFDSGVDLLAAWRDQAGCGQESSTEAEGVTTSRWQCDADTEMVVHVLAGQGHVWFGAPDAREPLWASEAMWEFFTTRVNG